MNLNFLYRGCGIEMYNFEVINLSKDKLLIAVRTHSLNGSANRAYFRLIHLLKDEELWFYTSESSDLKIVDSFNEKLSTIASISYIEISYHDEQGKN